MNSYVKTMVNKGVFKYMKKDKSSHFDGIHIMVESIALSHLYLLEYFTFVDQVLFEINNLREEEEIGMDKDSDALGYLQSDVRISTITIPGIFCIAGFLLSSDLSHDQIFEKISYINRLIKIDR